MSTLPPSLPEKQPPCAECGGRWSLSGRWSVGGQCAACAYGDLLGRPPDDRAERERLLAAHHARSSGQWYTVYHDGQNLEPPAPEYGVELLAVRAAWWGNPGLLALGGAFLDELRDHPWSDVVPPPGIPVFGPWVAVRWRVWWRDEPGFLQLERRPGQDWPKEPTAWGLDLGRADAAERVIRRAAGQVTRGLLPEYDDANELQLLQVLGFAVHAVVRDGGRVTPSSVARELGKDRRTVTGWLKDSPWDLKAIEREAFQCTGPLRVNLCSFHVRHADEYRQKEW